MTLEEATAIEPGGDIGVVDDNQVLHWLDMKTLEEVTSRTPSETEGEK